MGPFLPTFSAVETFGLAVATHYGCGTQPDIVIASAAVTCIAYLWRSLRERGRYQQTLSRVLATEFAILAMIYFAFGLHIHILDML